MSVDFARLAVPRLTTDMLTVSADSRSARLALVVLCALIINAPALAASDVADAVMQQDSPRLQGLLQESADVNAAQADGTTALHWAAYHADPVTVGKLLAA